MSPNQTNLPRVKPVVRGLCVSGRLGTLEQLFTHSFFVHGHDLHLYSYDAVQGVSQGVEIRDAAEICSRDSIFTYREGFGNGGLPGFADLFRHELLQQRGGWLVNMDATYASMCCYERPKRRYLDGSKNDGA